VPELPEVETVRAGLDRWVSGRTLAHVEVLHPRAVRRHAQGPQDFAARLAGSPVLRVERRGKYLWLELDGDEALLAHLGMSGQLVLPEPGVPDSLHLRVRLGFDDGGRELHFVDQRTFGGLLLSDLPADRSAGGGRRVPSVVAHVAPDPLEPAFDDGVFVRRLRRRRTGLKRALLDQTLVSGVGNIYADEALWRARLHYARATDTLSGGDARRLLAAVRAVLTASIAAGGTSFDALYVDVNGQSGWYSRSLDVYGRQGEPCRRCGSRVVREPFMNRSSYRCPRCQRRPVHPHW
jgi:formamidopyrimidine-DNA glycosylase